MVVVVVVVMVVFLFFIFLVSSAESQSQLVFIFGDSIFDVGNNNYINTTTFDKADFPPYGQTHFHFPTGRFSDGRLIPDFICKYAKLPLIPPYLDPTSSTYLKHVGANYASAGAGALVETFQGSVISLESQLGYHKRVVKNNLTLIMSMSKAVYLLSIGSNDYMSPYILTNSTHFKHHHKRLVQMVIGNITTAVKELHQIGGRKFGFMNLGPLGCLPGLRIILNPPGGCLQSASLLARLHNQALTKSLKKLSKQLKGFKYALYDFNQDLERRLKHPSRYGYKEGKTACCGTGGFRGTFSCGGTRAVKEYAVCENPKDYVFWDSYHLTERVYKQMAHQMWNQKPTTATGTSYNLKTLFQESP